MKLPLLFLISVVLLHAHTGFAEWRKVDTPGKPDLIRYLNFTRLRPVEEKAADSSQSNNIHLFEIQPDNGRFRIRLGFSRARNSNIFGDIFYLTVTTGVMDFSEPETAMQTGVLSIPYAELTVAPERFEEVLRELQRVVGELPAVQPPPVLPKKSNETIVTGVVLETHPQPPAGAASAGL